MYKHEILQKILEKYSNNFDLKHSTIESIVGGVARNAYQIWIQQSRKYVFII